MKTWIVFSLDDETIQGEETIQGRKLYEEIRYVVVYDGNHPFGLGPISKPKLQIGRNFWPILKLAETVKS